MHSARDAVDRMEVTAGSLSIYKARQAAVSMVSDPTRVAPDIFHVIECLGWHELQQWPLLQVQIECTQAHIRRQMQTEPAVLYKEMPWSVAEPQWSR